MNINDCILTAAGPGQLNDVQLAYYQLNGALSQDLNDAELEFLLVQGGTPGGSANDMWREVLSSRGYAGSLSDMKQSFWCADSGVVSLRAIKGWTGTAVCAAPSDILVTVEFNSEVTFTEGTIPNGVSINNHTTGESATISSATGSGTKVVAYAVTWITPPVDHDIIEWQYNGLGDYINSVPLVPIDLEITNCKTVAAPPIFSGSFDPPDGEVGAAYSYATAPLFAAGGPVTSYTVNVLPAGLNINENTGVIAGPPSRDGGLQGVTVTGTNIDGSDITNPASIDIVAAPSAPIPVFSGTFDPPDGEVGISYSYDVSPYFTAAGNPVFSSTSLPGGLNVDPVTGALSGVPTTAGSVGAIVISCTNSGGTAKSNAADINIAQGVMTQTIIKMMHGAGSGAGPATWNDVRGALATNDVLSADLLDENGDPTGVSLTSLVNWNGAIGAAAAAQDEWGWPQGIWNDVSYLTVALSGSDTLQLAGLPPGEPFLFRLAASSTAPNRPTSFDCSGADNGPIQYVPNAAAPPPRWVELHGTVPGTGVINLTMTMTHDWGYLSGSVLILGASDDTPPVLVGVFDLPDLTVGQSFGVDAAPLAASGSPPTGWALTGDYPSGASINADGYVSGVADTEQVLAGNSFGVEAFNGAGYSNTILDADGIEVSAFVPLSNRELVLDGQSSVMEMEFPITLPENYDISFKFSPALNTDWTPIFIDADGPNLNFTLNCNRGKVFLHEGGLETNWTIANGRLHDGRNHQVVLFKRGIQWTLVIDHDIIGARNSDAPFNDNVRLKFGVVGAVGTDIGFIGPVSDFRFGDPDDASHTKFWALQSGSSVSEESEPPGNPMLFTNIDESNWHSRVSVWGEAPVAGIPYVQPLLETGVEFFFNVRGLFFNPVDTIAIQGTLPAGLVYDDQAFVIKGKPVSSGTSGSITFTATSADGSLGIGIGTMTVSPGIPASFSEEPGFSLSGVARHNGALTIGGTGMGSKAQAAPRSFDMFDQYYNNGVLENPRGELTSGDLLKTDIDHPHESRPGEVPGAWIGDPDKAYGQQSASYSSYPPIAFVDFALDHVRGWYDQVEGETLYRRWLYYVEEGPAVARATSGDLSGGATVVTLSAASTRLIEGVFHRVSIVLDDGSLHRTRQVAPIISETQLNIEDPLPSPAASGNVLYYGSFPPTKLARIWDTNGGNSDVLQVSWTWRLIGTDHNGAPLANTPIPGQWNLMEILMHVPKLAANRGASSIEGRINGEIIGEVTGDYTNHGGDFNGFVPRLVGNNSSRPLEWAVPDNFVMMAQEYLDTTPQRIELADNGVDLYASTVREVCYIEAWSDTEIKVLLNQGAHAALSGLYIWHLDASNVPTLVGQVQ